MIGTTLGAMAGYLLAGYMSMVGTFGSPIVQIAIACTLIAIASLELCIRKRVKPATEDA